MNFLGFLGAGSLISWEVWRFVPSSEVVRDHGNMDDRALEKGLVFLKYHRREFFK